MKIKKTKTILEISESILVLIKILQLIQQDIVSLLY